MRNKSKATPISRYLVVVITLLLLLNIFLGALLMRQARSSMITLMHTRMLDISNAAAAMINGDDLERVTPADEGTQGYESIMRTLRYFQDNIDLKYIYCVRDMGDGRFTFGLDPTVEDPGEFGSPIVYTEALSRASRGEPSADDHHYEDAWGRFYSAYSPVYNSGGRVAGIIAVDFSAEWYERQLALLTGTTVILALLSLFIGAAIVAIYMAKSRKRLGSIQGQLNEMAVTLMHEMGNDVEEEPAAGTGEYPEEERTMDSLEKQIQSMQSELKTQIAQVHGQAYRDGLTGVKSKAAYLEAERELNGQIGDGSLQDFAVVVCDVNGLKKINDTLGHKAGDEYIRRSCQMICDIFSHSPVYRIGGDEFAVFLKGRDFERRQALMHELHKRSTRHISTSEAIVSGGMAEYEPERDHSFQDLFDRADAVMYKEKMLLKSLGAASREEEAEGLLPDADTDEILLIRERRYILIADDVESNREILGDLLQEDYGIYFAADGAETMEMLHAHKDEIAVLLLDLYMPEMDGRDVIARMQIDEELMSIPVIVLTVDQNAELESLKYGAMDFIPKPYPDIEIIKARISKCIELSENRELIRQTQRDKLTGLFNLGYFLRYVNRYDQRYRGAAFDALVCDINQLHVVNEQYGRQFGDLVVHRVGRSLRRLARKTGGIGGRRGLDTFLLYCPHQENYEKLLEEFLAGLFTDKETAGRVSMRFGVFANAQDEPDIEERFACADIAAEETKKDPGKLYGVYERGD